MKGKNFIQSSWKENDDKVVDIDVLSIASWVHVERVNAVLFLLSRVHFTTRYEYLKTKIIQLDRHWFK